MEKKKTYDRKSVGKRLRDRRTQIGWSRRYVAERVGLVEKYYADIERGTCGMSIETLMSLTDLYGFSLDMLLYGYNKESLTEDKGEFLLRNLEHLPKQAQDCCVKMLLMFIEGVQAGNSHEEEKVYAGE